MYCPYCSKEMQKITTNLYMCNNTKKHKGIKGTVYIERKWVIYYE